MIFNMTGCGGDAILNFKVVGNPQPSNPRENTIWVNTDTPITSWHFCVTEPDVHDEGAVWIQIGNSSDMEFNALKKNGIMACPLLVKQYIDGVWVDKDEKTYNGNSWSNLWHGKLYDKGEEWQHITGNLINKPRSIDSETLGTRNLVVTRNANSMKIDNTVSSTEYTAVCGSVVWEKKIDLTHFNTLTFKGTMSGTSTWRGLAIWSSLEGNVFQNQAGSIMNLTNGVGTIDISTLEGEFYIGFWVYEEAPYVVMESLILS